MLAVFLDIETTGLDPTKHKAIDIAFKIVDLSSNQLVCSYNQVINPSNEAWGQRDPASIEVNGYTWEQVAQGKDPMAVGREIVSLFTSIPIERGKAVFICQNPGFDRAFFTQVVGVYTQERLNWPYHWLDLASMYWAAVYHKLASQHLSLPEKMSLSKNDIAKEYSLPPEPDPHRAINGVNHLILCYKAVLGINASF